MSFLLFWILLQTPSCTATGLNLPDTYLSETEVWAMAQAKFGVTAWKLQMQSTQRKYPVVMVGYLHPEHSIPFGMPADCPSPYCWIDETGLWRNAWNKVLIFECEERAAGRSLPYTTVDH